MSTNPTVTLVSGGLEVQVPLIWHEEYLPYRWDWSRWQEHSYRCAQCAHHMEAVSAGHAFLPSPCPVGLEMQADLRQSVERQRTESLAN